jgi:pimeloyl-ACP methyl ester carboxylesterase
MDYVQRDGLRFEVTDRGPAEAPVVILLHGFPSDRRCWDTVSDRLVEAGYRTLAPDQRGYSPGARPRGRRAYRLDALGDDILGLADAAGVARFHLVGHDWGAVVAWHLAGTVPGRVATLAAVSVPHPRAMRRAAVHSRQALRSWYMLAFQVPALPERLLARRGGAGLRKALQSSGLEAGAARRYARRAEDPAGMRGPIGWYRAIPFAPRGASRPVPVPTVMIWSAGDAFITRFAAEGAAAWVDAPYRFVEVPGANHWLPENNPDPVADAVLDHLAAHPL